MFARITNARVIHVHCVVLKNTLDMDAFGIICKSGSDFSFDFLNL